MNSLSRWCCGEFVCNTNDKTISMAAIDSCVSNDGIKSLR